MWLAGPVLGGAGGTGAPARLGVHTLGDPVLLGGGVFVGQPLAAVGAPGSQVELKTAVVAVAAVDGPVAAGLALGQ